MNIINNNIKNFKLKNDIYIDFNQEIDILIQKIKTLGKFYDKRYDKYIIDSSILKNKDDFYKFFNLLNNRIKISNIQLLYRSSKDGLELNDLKNKINNKSNLIFLYLTGADRIFGAYIKTKLENIDLKGSLKAYKDEKAFAFSLNLNKKYKILIPEYATRIGSEFYILIGNNHNWNGFYYYQNVIYDKELLNEPKIYNFEKKFRVSGRIWKIDRSYL